MALAVASPSTSSREPAPHVMWFGMQRSELDFVDDPRALRIDASAVCPATPERVFAVLADPTTWPRWFHDMRAAAWLPASGAPGIGAVRRVTLGLGTFEERIIAWEPGVRFAFSIDGASVPLARRIVEDWRLAPHEGGAQLAWTMVATPNMLSRLARPVLEPMMRRMFRRSSEGLARYLRD